MPEDPNTNVQFLFDIAAITVAQATFVASIAAHLTKSEDNQNDNPSQAVRSHGGSSIGRLPNLN